MSSTPDVVDLTHDEMSVRKAAPKGRRVPTVTS
jgi:uncharacterized membrane protein